MANFNEHSLEMSIMELFQDEGYIYLNGEQIHRERSEVLLIDDLRKYLLNRYASEGLTPSEVDSIILRLRSISGTIYEANKAVCKMICDGFIFNREDHTKKDIYIELIDFDEPEKNVFKIVNQFEIEFRIVCSFFRDFDSLNPICVIRVSIFPFFFYFVFTCDVNNF